jgi:hypothetical protein
MLVMINHHLRCTGLEIIMAVWLCPQFFWDIILCCWVVGSQCSDWINCLHLQQSIGLRMPVHGQRWYSSWTFKIMKTIKFILSAQLYQKKKKKKNASFKKGCQDKKWIILKEMDVVYKCKISVASLKWNHTGSSTHNNTLNLITGECVKLPLKLSVVVHIPYLLQLWGYRMNKPWYYEHQEWARFTYTTNTTKDLRLWCEHWCSLPSHCHQHILWATFL